MKYLSSSQPFSTKQKFAITLAAIAIIAGGYFVIKVFGDTIFNLTLNTQDALERGLVAHFTFDGENVTSSGGGGGGGASGPWYQDYQYRREITINSSEVAATDSDVPILATTTLADLKSLAQGGKVESSGNDIVFVDDDHSTLLAFEQESYDPTTGEIVYWINTDISSTADETIYMYYGKASDTSHENVANVWPAEYKGVWHMAEDPSTTCSGTDEACDSAGTANNLNALGTWTSGNQIDGVVNGSLDFDISDNSTLRTANSASELDGIHQITMGGWMYVTDPGSQQMFLSKGGEFRMRMETGATHRVFFNAINWSGNPQWSAGANQIQLNAWNHIVLTFDDSNINNDPILYINGTANTMSGSASGSVDNGTTESWAFGEDKSTSNENFDGAMDEIRIASTVLTQADITTQYNMTRDNASFLAFGAEEEEATAAASAVTKRALDRSGNFHHGRIRGTELIPGAIGQSMDFDGVFNQVYVGDVNATGKTVAFWMKAGDTTSRKIVNLNNTDYVELNSSGQISAVGFPSATIYIDGVAGTQISDNEWHHITVVDQTGVDASGILLGHATSTYDATQFDHVLENFSTTTTLSLVGHGWDNTLVRNCVIHDVTGDYGINIREVDNVVVTNCEITNTDDDAIHISFSDGGTDDVIIDGNYIHDIQGSGITAPQRSQDDPTFGSRNLKIINNYVENTGGATSDGSQHSLYIQSPDFLIEGNTIVGERDGNGISVRSSGIVRGNIVTGTSKNAKPAIRYFSDHMKGPSNTLIIENNIVDNEGADNHVVHFLESLLYDGSGAAGGHVVGNFEVNFNTLVSFSASSYPISFSSYFDGAVANIEVVGNIAINTASTNYADADFDTVTHNYTSQSLAGFVRSTSPYDFHITPSHAANDDGNGAGTNPTYDIDGELRNTSNLDAGADQVGAVADAPSSYFDGALDDVRFYDRALSADEVERLYKLGATTKINTTINSQPELERDLLGHWTMDGMGISGTPGGGESGAWYNDTYAYRREVTINASQVENTDSAFTIVATTTLADLRTAGNGGHVQSSTGLDIVWVDDDHTTVLDYEVEKYDAATGQIVYWIKADVSASQDKTMYLYYGKSGASDLSDRENTWPSYWQGVWHFEDDPDSAADGHCGGGTTEVCDATSNDNDGEASTNSQNQDTASWLGNGLDFQNTGNQIQIPNTFANPDTTVMAWFTDTDTSSDYLFNRYQNTGFGWGVGLAADIHIENDIDGGDDDIYSQAKNINQWYHVAASIGGASNEQRMWLDGALVGSGTTATNDWSDGTTGSFWIGQRGQSSGDMDGKMDEVRIANKIFTDGEMETMYNNMADNSSFLTFASEEAEADNVAAGGGAFVLDQSGNGNNSTTTTALPAIGAIGQALSFDGVDDYVQIGDIDGGGTVHAIAFWMRVATTTASQPLINVDYSGGDRIETSGSSNVAATGFPAATVFVDGSSASAKIPDTGWHHVVVTDTTGVSADDFSIGSTTARFGGKIDDVRVYGRILSQDDIQRLYKLGATTKINTTVTTSSALESGLVGHYTFDGKDVSISSSGGAVAGGPSDYVAYWPFDTNADDMSSNNHDGTLTGDASITGTSKIGAGSLLLDGVGDGVALGTPATLNLTDSFTVATWVWWDVGASGPVYLFVDGSTGNQYWGAQLDGSSRLELGYDGSCGTSGNATGNTAISHGQWVHVAYSKNGTGSGNVKLYINAVESGLTRTMNCNLGNGNKAIGFRTEGSDFYFKGKIDDMYIYDRPLSDAEVTQIFEADGSGGGGGGATGEISDRSSSADNGTLTGGVAQGPGRIGQALEFNGVDGYIDIGVGPSTVRTVAFWMKASATTEDIIDLDGSNYIHLSTGTLTATGFSSPTIYIDGAAISALPGDGGWHHVAVTSATAAENASDLDLGRREGGSYFSGLLDDVHFYDRALSASEVLQLYQLGG